MMRVGYIDPFPRDSNTSWPRISAKFLHELRQQGALVEVYDERKLRPTLFDRSRQLLHRIKQERYLFEREPELLRSIATGASEHFGRFGPDVVISLSTLPLAYLHAPYPIVFWTDALFPGLVDHYPGFTDVCDQSLKYGDMVERLTLSKVSLAIFTSHWAAKLASSIYAPHCPPCEVVPWGADLPQVPFAAQLGAMIRKRDPDALRLLFIGQDWERKGGPELLEIRSELLRRGIPTELFIIGSTPELLNDDGNTHVLGYLNKKVDEDLVLMQQVLASSHLLILPARADSTAVVFAEACAYGVPILTTNVGGHQSIVQDGVNGYCYPHSECVRAITNQVQDLYNDREAYLRLALRARHEYDNRLNWGTATNQVMSMLERTVRRFEKRA